MPYGHELGERRACDSFQRRREHGGLSSAPARHLARQPRSRGERSDADRCHRKQLFHDVPLVLQESKRWLFLAGASAMRTARYEDRASKSTVVAHRRFVCDIDTTAPGEIVESTELFGTLCTLYDFGREAAQVSRHAARICPRGQSIPRPRWRQTGLKPPVPDRARRQLTAGTFDVTIG
jgi:hypothetical protein